MSFKDFRHKVTKGNEPPFCVLAIDPGHTTGYAFFQMGELSEFGQIIHFDSATNTIHFKNIIKLFEQREISHVVCENYKVYSHKLKEHTYSEIQTLRIIGIIQYICWLKNLPIHFQMAQEAKGFCTDAKLKKWDMYIPGMKHSRDAIRHGVYYLLFNGGKNGN